MTMKVKCNCKSFIVGDSYGNLRMELVRYTIKAIAKLIDNFSVEIYWDGEETRREAIDND